MWLEWAGERQREGGVEGAQRREAVALEVEGLRRREGEAARSWFIVGGVRAERGERLFAAEFGNTRSGGRRWMKKEAYGWGKGEREGGMHTRE
jgi:hypothetical protein